jgi:hypothetical protein
LREKEDEGEGAGEGGGGGEGASAISGSGFLGGGFIGNVLAKAKPSRFKTSA